ncbi:hypothetical protein [Aeromonas jandaei]|uniref:hypothetical protein n=1 Tax=Aeromonas jandaei TaxID=650 RepID=UPI001ABFF61E|nr:hypothetical protein [Aeromonas jandaei]QSR75026.1 EAL domain-containing protein [Aeromonas jandaei]
MPKTTTSNMKDGAAFDTRNVTPFFQHIVSVAADRKEKNEGIEILARIKAGDQYLTPASFIGTSCTSKLLNRLTSILLYKTLLHIKKLRTDHAL